MTLNELIEELTKIQKEQECKDIQVNLECIRENIEDNFPIEEWYGSKHADLYMKAQLSYVKPTYGEPVNKITLISSNSDKFYFKYVSDAQHNRFRRRR